MTSLARSIQDALVGLLVGASLEVSDRAVKIVRILPEQGFGQGELPVVVVGSPELAEVAPHGATMERRVYRVPLEFVDWSGVKQDSRLDAVERLELLVEGARRVWASDAWLGLASVHCFERASRFTRGDLEVIGNNLMVLGAELSVLVYPDVETVEIPPFEPVVLVPAGVAFDGTETGATVIYTVPAGKRALALEVLIAVEAVEDLVSVPTVRVDLAAGGVVVASQALTGIAAGKVWRLSRSGAAAEAADGAVVRVVVETAASAGTLTLRAYVMGGLANA